jgi:hypothetical protein
MQAKMMILYTPSGIEKMIKLECEIVDPTSETMSSGSSLDVGCPQLSAEF